LEITFKSRKLQKICNSNANLKKEFGDKCGKKIRQRLDEIAASDNMRILKLVHPRLHHLQGKRKKRMQHAMDLKHPYRLIIEPDQDPVPLLDDGGLDYEKITIVQVVEVEDYHGK
jgi:toxin HigB-1